MFANPILTESAGVNRHLFFSTFNYEWDRLPVRVGLIPAFAKKANLRLYVSRIFNPSSDFFLCP